MACQEVISAIRKKKAGKSDSDRSRVERVKECSKVVR